MRALGTSQLSWSFLCRGVVGDARPGFIYAGGFAALAQLAITQQLLHKHHRFRRTSVSQRSSCSVEVLSNCPQGSMEKGRGNEIQLLPESSDTTLCQFAPRKASRRSLSPPGLSQLTSTVHNQIPHATESRLLIGFTHQCGFGAVIGRWSRGPHSLGHGAARPQVRSTDRNSCLPRSEAAGMCSEPGAAVIRGQEGMGSTFQHLQ